MLIGLSNCNCREKLQESAQDTSNSVPTEEVKYVPYGKQVSLDKYLSVTLISSALHYRFYRKLFSHEWRFQKVKCNLSLEIFKIFS